MRMKSFEHNFNNIGDFINLNKDKLFRMWYKDEEETSLGANYIYIVGSIPIANDVILLIRHYDDSYEDNMYPHVDFVKLSEISLTYYEDDQEVEDEDK